MVSVIFKLLFQCSPSALYTCIRQAAENWPLTPELGLLSSAIFQVHLIHSGMIDLRVNGYVIHSEFNTLFNKLSFLTEKSVEIEREAWCYTWNWRDQAFDTVA